MRDMSLTKMLLAALACVTVPAHALDWRSYSKQTQGEGFVALDSIAGSLLERSVMLKLNSSRGGSLRIKAVFDCPGGMYKYAEMIRFLAPDLTGGIDPAFVDPNRGWQSVGDSPSQPFLLRKLVCEDDEIKNASEPSKLAISNNHVDSNGVEWMRCPLQASGMPSCSTNPHLDYFQAVEAVAKLGPGWRLPEVADFRSLAADLDRRLIARGAGNQRCADHIFNEVSTVLNVHGVMWSEKLYTPADETIYRTKELLSDAIATTQVPNCRNPGGRFPVYGFGAELVTRSYLTYAVRDTNGTKNPTWERTAGLVLNQKAQLQRQDEVERDKEQERQRQDRAALFAELRSSARQEAASSMPPPRNATSGAAAQQPAGAQRQPEIQVLREHWTLKDEVKSIVIRCGNGAERAYSLFAKTGRYCTPSNTCSTDRGWIHRALCQ
jgi:hypothetical protein